MTTFNILDLVLKLLLFAWFSFAAFTHFAPTSKEPAGSLAVKAISVVGLGINTWLIFSHAALSYGFFGMGLTIVSASVFHLGLRASQEAGLHVSFSAPTGSTLVSNGIYRFVRNPLYLSYILYWLSWAVSLAFHPLSIAVLLVLSVFYMASIKLEEQELELKFGETYKNYKNRTARLVPYLF